MSTIATTAKRAVTTIAATKAATATADATSTAWDAVSDALDRTPVVEDDDGLSNWAWLAIGVTAMTGVGFGVRAWRRRRAAQQQDAPATGGHVKRFETIDATDEPGYRSSTDAVTDWELPQEADTTG